MEGRPPAGAYIKQCVSSDLCQSSAGASTPERRISAAYKEAITSSAANLAELNQAVFDRFWTGWCCWK